MSAITKSKMTIAGCEIVVHRGGEGPPLLYFHGAGPIMSVQPFMELLAKDFDLIVPTHPGFGESEMPDWLEGMGDLGYFYQEFMAELGLEGVHLGGTSLGGWLASEVALRSTERLKTLTLVGAGGIHVEGVKRGKSSEWGPEETLRQVIYDQKLAEKMITKMPKNQAENPQHLKNRATVKILAKPPTFNPDIQKWAHIIKIPVHIIWGEADRLIPVDFAPVYAALFDNVKVDIIPECGHLPYVEVPELYAEMFKSFADANA